MKIIIIFSLITNLCYAEDIQLTSDFILKKPDIPAIKKLSKDEQKLVENSLKNQGRKLIHKELKPLYNDYQHDFNRGTVEYTPNCKNYSFHKIIIPDGTIIKESNFSQKEPHTQAIIGKNLTFTKCNLVNIEPDATWIIQDSNNCQIKNIKKSESEIDSGKQKKVIVSHQVEVNGIFEEIELYEEIVNSGDDYNLFLLRLNQ